MLALELAKDAHTETPTTLEALEEEEQNDEGDLVPDLR